MATPSTDETEISSTTFLIGAVVVIGLFIAIQIGRVIMAPAEEPVPTAPTPDASDPDVEDVEDGDEEPKEPAHKYDSPLRGEVEYDADRKRLVVKDGDERQIVPTDELIGLERESDGSINLRASDGRRVTVTEEFVAELPTRVRYQFDYESSGNIELDNDGNEIDPEGRIISGTDD